MASPLNNLRKPRKAPLPGVHHTEPGQRQAPFRNPTDIFDDDPTLDDLLGRSVSSRQSNISTSKSDTAGHRGSKHLPKLSKDAKTSPSDYELMSSMMSRIAQLELRVQYYAKQVIEKDKKISILEDKTKLIQKYKGDTDIENQRVKGLERKCEELQRTIKDMEDFLSDYGMIWVGDAADKDASKHNVYEELPHTPGVTQRTGASMWRPGASVVLPEGPFHIDFDRIVENIKELNIIAGEGEKRIRHTVSGARLVAPDPVPLTLYANGIFMFNGPFRPYEDPTTQRCIQDFMEGYFPYELSTRFPDGVPFQVTDKRDTMYNDPRNIEQFPGSGNLLGGETKPSRLVPSNLDKGTTMEKSYTTSHDGNPVYQTSQPPKPRLTVDQFLAKLPPAVMREGKIIDVRASVGKNLKHDSSKQGVMIIDTPAVQAILDHTSSRPQSSSQPTSSHTNIATLRIKSQTGENTFILKMQYTDTIGDIRKYLDAKRPTESRDYDIVSTFPAKVYSDQSAILQECGLTPNAALYLMAKKK